MKQEIAELWVAALRSGQYKQGKGRLFIEGPKGEDNKFCCLGVLCDLAKQNKVNLAGVGKWIPSFTVIKWAGISLNILEDRDSPYNLWRMNDRDNKSFEEIADFIENNWSVI